LLDGISYTEDELNCDGSVSSIISQKYCIVPVATFKDLPFELDWNTGVYANVQAFNAYGNSATSLTGNGATLVTIPDAPINLQNDASVTTATQIGINWEDGAFDGGEEVTDYRIYYDQGEGYEYPTYYVLQSGVTVQYLLVAGLTTGLTYNFEVQAHNAEGYSASSISVRILAA
jgi:hypothetical protein